MKITSGKLDIARQVASPNYDQRPENEISLVVIHGISLPAGHFGSDFVEALFCNQLDCSVHGDFAGLAGVKVSSHLFIRRSGQVIQFVPFNYRAWHAGVSSFEGRENCNDFSVGIELEGTDQGGYSELQYQKLRAISGLMQSSWCLTTAAFVGHADIAPGRKTDPGVSFDWCRFRRGLRVQAPNRAGSSQ